MNYFILKNHKTSGPFNGPEILEQLQAGTITESDLFRVSDRDDWKPVRSLLQKKGINQSPTPGVTEADAGILAPADENKPGGKYLDEAKRIASRSTEFARENLEFAPLSEGSKSLPPIKRFRPLPFVFALFCFLLPVVRFSCSMQPNMGADLSGLQLLTGTRISVGTEPVPIPPNPAIAWVFVGTVIALLASLFQRVTTSTATAGIIAASVAVLALLLFKAATEAEVRNEGEGIIVGQFQAGYWGILIGLGTGIWMNIRLLSMAGKAATESDAE